MAVRIHSEDDFENSSLLVALNAAAASIQRESMSEQGIYAAFCDQVAQLGLRGGILVLDESKQNLTVKTYCRPKIMTEAFEVLESISGLRINEYTFPLASVAVYQQVVKSHETVYVSDTSSVAASMAPKVTRKVLAAILNTLGNFPGIYSPLIIDGTVIGTMNIVGKQLTESNIPTMQAFANHIAIALNTARLIQEIQKANQALEMAYNVTLDGWVQALDFRHHDTKGHTQRVADRTVEFARRIGLPEKEFEHVQRGALLHDIGKIGISDEILLKEGALDANEWLIMKKHPENAYRWLSSIEYLSPALEIPYCHHEKWDGSGYPRGLKETHIPLTARLFTLVDVWDAITSDRPYRKAMSRSAALKVMKEETGTRFDPELAPVFMQLIEQ